MQELLNPVFLGCDIADDALMVTVQIAELLALFSAIKAIKLPFKSPARNRGNHSESRISTFLSEMFFMWRAFTTSKIISPANASSNIS